MRVLVVWAHPLEDSFSAALYQRTTAALEAAGHAVDRLDLYREGFEARLSPAERRTYHDPGGDRTAVADHVARLRAAEGLVFVFPTWNFGVPAILKGWFERVLLPGVAFTVEGGATRPGLGHIRRFACVTTYGARRWVVKLVVGDPNRAVFMRGFRRLMPLSTRATWLPLYDMNTPDPDRRAAFLDRVDRTFRAW
jgi:putative NADPH-quinone reductase